MSQSNEPTERLASLLELLRQGNVPMHVMYVAEDDMDENQEQDDQPQMRTQVVSSALNPLQIKESVSKMHYMGDVYKSTNIESNPETGMFHITGHPDVIENAERIKLSANPMTLFLQTIDETLALPMQPMQSLSNAYVFLQQTDCIRLYKENLLTTSRLLQTIDEQQRPVMQRLAEIVDTLNGDRVDLSMIGEQLALVETNLIAVRNTLGMLSLRLCQAETYDCNPGSKALVEHVSHVRKQILLPLYFLAQGREAFLRQAWSDDLDKRSLLKKMLSRKITKLISRIDMLIANFRSSHWFACGMLMARAKFVKRNIMVPSQTGGVEYFSEFCE